MQDFTGQTHGLFEIIEKLADEAFYTVYKAIVHRHIPIMATLKIFRKEYNDHEEFRHRFDRMGNDLMKLKHENILLVGDYGEMDGQKFLATRFREGQTLSEILSSGPQSLPFVRKVITQIGDALHYAHDRNIIHRDVKPNNIWINQEGYCWLTNFEIAKLNVMLLQSPADAILQGNPTYLSPEQLMNERLDVRSDIYSLGLVLYEMVTGVQPFQADTTIKMIAKKIQESPPSPRTHRPEISAELEAVILKALAREREERFQTAGEMVEAVEGVIAA